MSRKMLVPEMLVAFFVAACGSSSESGPGDAGGQDAGTYLALNGLDVLVVTDNSTGSGGEHLLISESIPFFFDALSDASASSSSPVEDVRFAVVSSDMGLSWGGEPYGSEDGWPGGIPDTCSSNGYNGAFQTDWMESSPDSPNPDLPSEAQSVLEMGQTFGCSIGQPMQAAAIALTRPDQADFSRSDSLLLIIMISNDEDCSLEDGPGFFALDEIQNPEDGPSYWTPLVCALHPEYMYPVEHYFDLYSSLKNHASNGVLFITVSGATMGSVCEGSGDEIGGCLDDPDMSAKAVLETKRDGTQHYNQATVCDRVDGSAPAENIEPGRRYVQLAEEFGEMGLSYSACNGNWTSFMGILATKVRDTIESSNEM